MFMEIKLKTILSIAFGCIFCGLWAQNNTKTQRIVSLQECIRQALENNLILKSGQIAVEKAKNLQATAFNIEKTNVSLSQDPTTGGSPDNSLSISQSFEFPSVYIIRHRMLKAETELEQSRLDISVNEVIKEVSSLYYQLLRDKERIRILQRQDSIYRKFLFLATARLKAGESNRLEQINAKRLCNENQLTLQNAGHDFQNLQLMLQSRLNTNEMIEPQEDSLPTLTVAYPVDELNVTQTPQNRMYESQRLASEKNLSLQRQEFMPDFNFALRNQLLIKGFNPYDVPRERFDKGNFMGFEAGISFPLFFGEQRAKTKAAKKEVEIIRTQQKNALLFMRKEYETALNEYEKAKTGLDYYRQTGIRQAEEITKISRLSYENGEIGYIEYIQNLQMALEIHLQYADAVNEYNQSIILLNFLQGKREKN
jgi:cobalt-zinc-cadmium resistance protein CzcA